MKTTIQIPDDRFEQARRLAQCEGTALKALKEEGLRRIVTERQQTTVPLQLRDAPFGGAGLQPDVADASWSQIRDMSY